MWQWWIHYRSDFRYCIVRSDRNNLSAFMDGLAHLQRRCGSRSKHICLPLDVDFQFWVGENWTSVSNFSTHLIAYFDKNNIVWNRENVFFSKFHFANFEKCRPCFIFHVKLGKNNICLKMSIFIFHPHFNHISTFRILVLYFIHE